MDRPTTNLNLVWGFFVLSTGIITLLVTLFVIQLSSTGYVQRNTMTLFTVILRLAIVIGTLAFLFFMIYLFRWLAYYATTPKWKQEEDKYG